jgi:hypothetical protein
VKNVVWTLADALPLLREVQAAVEPLGYHTGLVGSVITKGFSHSDLDMVIYPASIKRQAKDAVVAVLKELGMRRTHTVEKVHAAWKKMGSDDTKHVEKWMSPDKLDYRGRPVDVFFLS